MTTVTVVKGPDKVTLKANGKEVRVDYGKAVHRFYRWAKEDSYFGGQYTVPEMRAASQMDGKDISNALQYLLKKEMVDYLGGGGHGKSGKWVLYIGEPVPEGEKVDTSGLVFSNPEQPPDAFKAAVEATRSPFDSIASTQATLEKLKRSYGAGAAPKKVDTVPVAPAQVEIPEQRRSSLAHSFRPPRRDEWEQMLADHAHEHYEEFQANAWEPADIKGLDLSNFPKGMKVALYYDPEE